MRIDDLANATKLAAQLRDAQDDLQNAKDAACVRLDLKYPYPGTGFWYVTDSDGTNESASGEIGVLAGALRAAAVAYYQARCSRLRAQLTALGVEL